MDSRKPILRHNNVEKKLDISNTENLKNNKGHNFNANESKIRLAKEINKTPHINSKKEFSKVIEINEYRIHTNSRLVLNKPLEISENIKEKILNVKVNKECTETRRVTSRKANTLFLLLRISMDLNILWKQWLICLLITCVSGYREQKFAMEPQDQSAVVGSRVTLPCRVEGKSGQLQWTKDDFGLGTHRHLSGYERYTMIGSDEEGDYSLDIANVTLDDDALYQCQVSTGPRGEPAIRSRYGRLIILVAPQPPRIVQGPVLSAVEDRDVHLECVSVGGKPAAEITWVDHDGGVLTQGVNYTIELMPDGRRYIARSVLHLRPRRLHHNQSFTCQAQNTADRAYRSVSIQLQVQYAPRVKMFLKTGVTKGRVQEGDTVVIGCQASANPNALTYKWFLNNEQLYGDIRNELVLKNISRKLNEGTVKCEVHNTVGKSADTKTLEVSYGPSFKAKPQDMEADLGSKVTLTCQVEGHPTPQVTWLRFENNRLNRIGKSPNLTLSVATHSGGQYWCRGSIEGRLDVEAPATLFIKGPPHITSNQSQYGVEGEDTKIECISLSIPAPEYVLWAFGGEEIHGFHKQEYAFLEETLPDRSTKSTLVIKKSESKHFGTYNCTVINAYGSDSVEIVLVPDKSIPLLLILTAAASIIIIILIIMLCVMLCHRRPVKTDKKLDKKPDITDLGKSCEYKESDRNSNISDLKLELRQVEGCDMEHSTAGSETELHPTLHLTSNLGLPLAGPVPLPTSYDNEVIKCQRYSGDFNQAINQLNFKTQGQSNGYVPYVDYSRDYAPPSDSLSGSLSRSIDGSYSQGSLRRQASCGRLGGLIGPDVIPMTNPGVVLGSLDVRYAATYGNPYLRGSGQISYVSQSSTPPGKHAPPPYYTLRSHNHHSPGPSISPASSVSSRPVTSPMASSSSTPSSAQPQVPKVPLQSAGALYILPPSNQGNKPSTQKINKGPQVTPGTHV